MVPTLPPIELPAPRWTLRRLAVWSGFVVAFAAMLTAYRYLGELSEGYQVSLLEPLINEGGGVIGAGLMLFPIAWLVHRWPLERAIARRLPIYVGALVVLSVAHTSWNWGTRAVLYPLAGLGSYDYGKMPLRYMMEAPVDVIVVSMMVAALHLGRRLQRARLGELRAARLESSLASAQLANLRLQLQPHFLFNALNTISSTMYTDPRSADEILERLAALIRAALRTASVDEVSLAEEIELLEHYIAVMRARFGDRLTVSIDVDPHVHDAMVPSLLLQPLVENAIRHGGLEQTGSCDLQVHGSEHAGTLELVVRDDGGGHARSAAVQKHETPHGIGLTATSDRLRILYGSEHDLVINRLPEGGFEVTIRLPLKRPS